MKELPILFSGAMVKAILAGAKTQTRRLIRDKDRGTCQGVDTFKHCGQLDDGSWMFTSGTPVSEWRKDPDVVDYLKGGGFKCQYGQSGDRLWVRETWAAYTPPTHEYNECDLVEGPPSAMRSDDCWVRNEDLVFAADGTSHPDRWRPGIYMPRWASRLTLEVTAVRVERLNAISASDAVAEGVVDPAHGWDGNPTYPRARFAELWDAINGKRASWQSNPWVWVVSFRRVEQEAKAA